MCGWWAWVNMGHFFGNELRHIWDVWMDMLFTICWQTIGSCGFLILVSLKHWVPQNLMVDQVFPMVFSANLRHRFLTHRGIFWPCLAFNGEQVQLNEKTYLRFPVLRRGGTGSRRCSMMLGILITNKLEERMRKKGGCPGCLIVFNKLVETSAFLIWIGDETSTTRSYSDVHPRETTSIHARLTLVTVVVSSQRCDGCDGESRTGTLYQAGYFQIS